MKTKYLLTIVLAIAIFGNVAAEETGSNGSGAENIYIKSPKFAQPLLEKWIQEYSKVEPNIHFEIVKGNNNGKQIDMMVVVSDEQMGQNANDKVVYFGEYAILPITAYQSEAAKILEGKHLNAKTLKQIFFFNEDYEENLRKNKQFERLVIYSGSNKSSIAHIFAQHYGEVVDNFRGKRISGDDLFLNTALSKDPFGISFNTLPNIFDLKSRHLKNNLTLIGLDLKKEVAGNFTNSSSLDDIIKSLETERNDKITIGKVGLSYNGSDDAINRFLSWILTNGVQYNHEYGLLNLDQKVAEIQKINITSTYTAQNNK